ncbi:MBL fold metallo-hydrolase [Myroides injenensis]|uniref:MBL fold metallo-hydrolase n=1 Tax=Myroides injenensis TaxID=1183151 RepID=UPI000289307A|nr:MBL fold metallo-hydrolase [Myroides injenensis]
MKILPFKVEERLDNGQNIELFPSLLVFSNGTKYLVDCGYSCTFEEFEKEVNIIGYSISQLDGIIISHDDIDHLEGLAKFKKANPNLIIISSAIERDSIEGTIPAERLVQVQDSLAFVPQEQRGWVLQFAEQLKNIERFPVNRTYADGDYIEGELRVVYTPGHTKGHLSLFHEPSGILVANDALVIEEGNFNIANPQFTLDIEQAIKSVKKLKELQPSKIICYHGGVMESDIDSKLNDLLLKY